MSRTICIDDEVHAFLQSRRRHRGKSSNDVLRRWLGLDPTSAKPDSVALVLSGEVLSVPHAN